MFTYLSHEESENIDVYFDDFTLALVAGPVIQVDDYYPYGMAFNHELLANEVLNRYLYQGKEKLSNDTDWYDFHARLYSPALGRFLGVDPANQFISGYVGMGNSPINGTDPSGMWFGVDDAVVAGVGLLGGYVVHGISTGHWGKDALKAGVITAGAAWLGYNTAGLATGLLTQGGLGAGAASVLGSGVGGAVGSASSSIAGQAYFNNGKIDGGTVGQAALYGFGGGLATGLVGITPLGDQVFPMHHIVKHMVNSTAYQMGGNIITGNNPLANNSFGLDPSIVLPAFSDVASLTSRYWSAPLANKLGKNGNVKEKIVKSMVGMNGGKYLELTITNSSLDFYVDSNGFLEIGGHGTIYMKGKVSGGNSYQRFKASFLASGNIGLTTPKEGFFYPINYNNRNFNHINLAGALNNRKWWRSY